ncbi:carbohydrate esterase family 9 protein [Polychaeton citri CBS 116435]|uniref:N-acetylglucosamine-6-phosphate deacetylase n=1 Tax=Polychaeton citri CBS 116435 TaxID=1314669 RepID=A0A9P4Q306_9PEZI|nr:carbohydrate esterase family 9 protein [Polychaeton citri CBS 116435]
MPIAVSPERPRSGITRLTGARLVKGDDLVEEDLWISSVTGKILNSQEVFYGHGVVPDEVIDLKGKIITPGFLDVQFNGAFGFDFSTIPEDVPGDIDGGMASYAKGLGRLNRKLVHTGVTSYLPTLPSQKSEVYHKALKYLGPSGTSRNALEGSESLGAHCEGPFISPTKNGIHNQGVLQEANDGFLTMEACYGRSCFPEAIDAQYGEKSPISLVTLAPEVPGVALAIPELVKRGIRVAIGHTEATYEDAKQAISLGVTMITHLFNAMRPLHHRNPGIFGVLGQAEGEHRPYYGVIADGIHLHPTSVKIAWNANPEGFTLVTDAMKTVGLPDGIYDWTNGDKWVKKGPLLTRYGEPDKIAGSSATLIECVNNFWNWSNASIPEVIRSVTRTPAKMLGLESVKGSLSPNADADLLALDIVQGEDGNKKFVIDRVWKFGMLVHDNSDEKFGL